MLIVSLKSTCLALLLLLSNFGFKIFGQDTLKAFRNSLEVGGRYELYEEGYRDRTYLYLQYGRTIQSVDAYLKLLQYTLYAEKAYAVESDVYWKFKNKGYANFNASYSESELLPLYRLRAEVFKNYKQFEYSLGAGTIKPLNYDLIVVLTGIAGIYLGDYFFYIRPTISRLEDGYAKNFLLHGRKYFSKTDFISITLLRGEDTGTVRNFNSIENSFGLDSYLARLSARVKKGDYFIGIGLDFGGLFIPQRDEYASFVGFDLFLKRGF